MPPDQLSQTLSALADPTRRSILARLSIGDATVSELAEPYDMSLAAVSKHLKVLEGAGLISRSRESQWRPCHLEAEPLAAVSEWLEDYRRFWDRSLDSLADYLKTMKTTNPKPSRRSPKSSSRKLKK
ncbi:MAG TPA: metalloregulator ArsR/SmtB family transcription factor [Hyphomonadaceae bacterium]|nr:metalloregulator ArsR/SmtB family transcription factor [Hyphomonadaceae bacterium]